MNGFVALLLNINLLIVKKWHKNRKTIWAFLGSTCCWTEVGSASISRPRGSLAVVERYAFEMKMARITLKSFEMIYTNRKNKIV